MKRLILSLLITLQAFAADTSEKRLAAAQQAIDSATRQGDVTYGEALKAPNRYCASQIQTVSNHLGRFSTGNLWRDRLNLKQLAVNETSPTDVALLAIASARELLQPGHGDAIYEFLSSTPFYELDRCLATLQALLSAETTVTAKSAGAQWLASLEQYEKSPTSSQLQKKMMSDANLVQALICREKQRCEVSEVMLAHYQNFNVRVYLSEPFFQRSLNSPVQQTVQGVRDSMLGASVGGTQTNNVGSTVDFVPSQNGAKYRVNVSGHIQSSNVSVPYEAPKVSIYSRGNHAYTGTSEVTFDGKHYRFSTPSVGVDVSNQLSGVNSSRGHGLFGIIKNIEKNTAWEEAQSKRWQAERITADKISRNVSAEMNQALTKGIQQANETLQKNVISPLVRAELFTPVNHASSTQDSWILSFRGNRPTEIAGGVPPIVATGTRPDMLVQMHESFLNNSANRMSLAGAKLTTAETADRLKAFMAKVFPNAKVSFALGEEAANNPNLFLFETEDPIRVRLLDGSVQLVLRFGIKKPNKEPIPAYEITVPLHLAIDKDRISVKKGTISLRAVEPKGGAAVLIAAQYRRAMNEVFADESSFSRFQTGKNGQLEITQLRIVDGWVEVGTNWK